MTDTKQHNDNARTFWQDLILERKFKSVNLTGLVVCLDNGHGKATKGKASPWTLHQVEPQIPFREYEFTRKVTAKLKELLEAMGAYVYLVCPEVEGDISLSARAARANNLQSVYKAKGKKDHFIFVSVHANAMGLGDKWYPKTDGWSVWTTRGQNNSDTLATCLWEAADEMFTPMGKRLRREMSDGDPDWESDFTVIKKANMPAVLTENFFYTDPDDCKYINTERGIEEIAIVHANGIAKFAQKKYNMGYKDLTKK